MDPELALLQKNARFTAEDLAANRAGRLSPAQMRGRPGAGGFIFVVVFGLLFLGGGVGGAAVFYDSLSKPVERVDMNAVYAIAAGGVLLALGSFALAISVLRDARRRRVDYDRGTCSFWDIRFTANEQDPTFKQYFYVYRNDERLQIPRAVAREMKPGSKYRVYIAGGRLISLEPLP